MTGTDLPLLRTAIPGPESRAWVDRLARRECPAITARRARRAAAMGVADTDPIVWAEALGANVLDVDGNRFVDATAGFGVAAVGHRHPKVVEAAKKQMDRLLHAMGDAFPDPTRIRLLERLAELSGFDHGILGSSGSDAVEAALKTALIASGRAGVLAFEGGYHGLSYGGLGVCGYKPADFRGPFAGQLGQHARFAPYGGEIPDLADVGAVIVEPIQGRGGMRRPPPGWLSRLREACDRAGTVLIFDEIYSGFGRSGRLFAMEHDGVRPDLICLGKGLASGFPISACMGRREVMEAWGASKGESIHTQTFLGHPVGCAMALASIDVIAEEGLVERAAESGRLLEERLGPLTGAGLLRGWACADPIRKCRQLMERGFIALPAGLRAEVVGLTPPLMIGGSQLHALCDSLLEEE